MYNIKYFEGQKVSAFHRYKLLQMTNSETIYRQYTGKLLRSAYFNKTRGHKLSRKGPKNAKTEKLSVSENFFPLGILKCAFYFLEGFFTVNNIWSLFRLMIDFWGGSLKGHNQVALDKNLTYVFFFFFLRKLSLKFWVTSLYRNSVSLKENSSNL